MKKKSFVLIGVVFAVSIVAVGAVIWWFPKGENETSNVIVNENKSINTTAENTVKAQSSNTSEEKNQTVKKIELHDLDGQNTNFSFQYNGKTYTAKYTKDNWKIVDSYTINKKEDMEVICEALIDIHPIHGKDMVAYRTSDDMVTEWKLHNYIYNMLPEDSRWKNNAKDVDFNPQDQGLSLEEMYKIRTGRKISLEDVMKTIRRKSTEFR